ncbi:DNA polymerase III subunit chi [Phaeovulum sp.]|uniref:DNA polymerase III subunit chi n=1 Tax=Phaeovulum sp. TaxID=2934796 RepID=UPI00272F6299|nr:DNA polymerase III subunit chi [Phaeovulum sp.]MDP1669783.1 DNA polymerase III subunit chi [Phaeovulum sp.]MDZ4119071.1 DNA polymerase III subunit chi [Phaeovulum sp.]
MAQALFYQLGASPLAALVATLATRALAQGWRVELRGTDRARMEQLDGQLWLGQGEGFLPHGLCGGPADARQPILLTHGPGPAANTPMALMAIDAAEVDPAEAAALQRVWVIFDGALPEALEHARAQWRQLSEILPAQYWSDVGGRWEKKAERAPG